jgi:hypothetical protein
MKPVTPVMDFITAVMNFISAVMEMISRVTVLEMHRIISNPQILIP